MQIALSAGLESSLHVTVGFALGDVAALVAPLLAAGQGKLDLGAPVLEVEPRRDHGEALLADLAREGLELLLVKQELSVAVRIVVGQVALVVDRDVGPDEPGLPVPHVRVGLLKGGPAVAKGLDLSPGQDQACLHPVEQVVVVPGPPVVGDELFASICHPKESRGLVVRAVSDLQSVWLYRGSYNEEQGLSGLRRLIAGSARAPLFLLCALVLATVVVPAALADDPPPTTTAPPPDPAPDPAPTPKPKPKPKPKPAPHPQPRPRPTPTPTPTPTPSPSSAPQPNVVHVQKPVVKKPVRKHVKPKKKVHRKKVVAEKPQRVVPTITTLPQVSGASFGSSSVLRAKSSGSGGLASTFIVMALVFAIACLSIALVPAKRVPWRPAAVFVSERQIDLTVAGMALLVATAFTLILTGGF